MTIARQFHWRGQRDQEGSGVLQRTPDRLQILSIDEKNGRGLSAASYSLLKKSVISGVVQSMAPINFRRITPLRSMI